MSSRRYFIPVSKSLWEIAKQIQNEEMMKNGRFVTLEACIAKATKKKRDAEEWRF